MSSSTDCVHAAFTEMTVIVVPYLVRPFSPKYEFKKHSAGLRRLARRVCTRY
jgi:hypothetical protein